MNKRLKEIIDLLATVNDADVITAIQMLYDLDKENNYERKKIIEDLQRLAIRTYKPNHLLA